MRTLKNILFFILLFLITTITVKADNNNRLVFNFDNNKHNLYYDTSQFDKDSFLHYLNMQPGVNYQETLNIVNSSKDTFQLYLKVRPSQFTEEEKILLENIIISIYNGDELIYTGSAMGIEESFYDDVIPLGVFDKKSTDNLVFVTYLKDDYEIQNDSLIGRTTWDFYAISDTFDGIINPNTTDYVKRYAVISIVSFVLMLLLLITYYEKIKEKNTKK